MDYKETLKNELIDSFIGTVDSLMTTPIYDCGIRSAKQIRGSAEDVQKLIKHVYNEYHELIDIPEFRVEFYPNGLYKIDIFDKVKKNK